MGVEKVKAIIYLLFSFRGRISRKQWWFGIGVSYAFIFILYIFVLAVSIDLQTELSIDLPDELFVLLWIPFLWVPLALNIKRHHDRNRPGWWTIITLAIWGVLLIIPGVRGIVPILWIVFFGCLRGNAGKNRYGPPPKPLFLAADKPISNETETVTSEPLDPK